jgi:hypothetical protein
MNLGKHHGRMGRRSGWHRQSEYKLIADILRKPSKDIQVPIHVLTLILAAAIPPLLQDRAELHLFLNELARLAQRLAHIGNTRKDDGIRGQEIHQPAAVTQSRHRDRIQLGLQFHQFIQQRQMFAKIAAPGNFILDWHRRHARMSRDLIARTKLYVFPAVLDLDRAFDYRNT